MHQAAPSRSPAKHQWHLFVPKLVTVLREGYGAQLFRADAVAGLTVAIVALPLAMALAIASGATPAAGLITAVIAGFLISALGGSRFQIGGPTGAFVVVVYGVVTTYGYDGLLLATLMAGVILVIAGLARFGTIIKYFPHPVVTGFTAGIAVIIFSSQVKDFAGLDIVELPAEFLPKWQMLLAHVSDISPATLGLSLLSLALIIALRHFAPKAPGFLLAVVLAAILAWAFHLPVDTIGSRFGELPRGLPAPSLPDISLERVQALLPSAFTIAFLAGIEALLSAVVADGMTGRRHRSNCELVAQGVANCASALFAGLPATGAIARTATNIRAGGRTPISGILHAVFLLLFMMVAAPLASFIPLASLAAVLMIVAWNMSEIKHFRHLMKAPVSDRVLLLVTFFLTVLVDLTVAIEVGVVLAALFFMHRMTQAVEIGSDMHLIEEDADDWTKVSGETPAHDERRDLPPGVAIYQIRGPFFFGVASRLLDILDRIGPSPRIIILRLRDVPMIDASGAGALSEFIARCRKAGINVILSALQPQPRATLKALGLLGQKGVYLAGSTDLALGKARAMLSSD